MKGWIALDIDGTLTTDKFSIPSPVIHRLKVASQEGWLIALATGRTYSFAKHALSELCFPYFLLPQNGSIILKMPSKEIVLKSYLDPNVISTIKEVFATTSLDFIVYTGFENHDRCFYRPTQYDEEFLVYLDDLQSREGGGLWTPVQEFSIDFPVPLIKAYGRHDELKKISNTLQSGKIATTSLIKDPFHPSYYILLITSNHASKGLSLEALFQQLGRGRKVIAAGDDENDISLFQVADVKIAMPHAPEKLRMMADFVAPSVSEMGIIKAIDIVLKSVEHKF